MVKVIESLLIEAGISPLAGVDEAGRGACAGPLVIASVVLADPFAPELAKVRDSKDVSEAEREKLFWEVVHSLQRKKKAERRQLEERLAGAGGEGKRAAGAGGGGGDSKRSRTK